MNRRDKPRNRKSSATSMAELAAAAATGEGADFAGGMIPRSGEEDKKPKLAAVPAAAVGESSSSAAAVAVAVSVRRGGGPSCKAERCGADLADAGQYNRRHKVCEPHSKAPVVVVAGLRQRFCQQCSRFHELSEFDDMKRSCRLRLAGHNERRRKSSAEAHGDTGAAAASPTRKAGATRGTRR